MNRFKIVILIIAIPLGIWLLAFYGGSWEVQYNTKTGMQRTVEFGYYGMTASKSKPLSTVFSEAILGNNEEEAGKWVAVKSGRNELFTKRLVSWCATPLWTSFKFVSATVEDDMGPEVKRELMDVFARLILKELEDCHRVCQVRDHCRRAETAILVQLSDKKELSKLDILRFWEASRETPAK